MEKAVLYFFIVKHNNIRQDKTKNLKLKLNYKWKIKDIDDNKISLVGYITLITANLLSLIISLMSTWSSTSYYLTFAWILLKCCNNKISPDTPAHATELYDELSH